MIDYELRVGNSQRSRNAQIAYAIKRMTPEQRQHALERIQATTLIQEPDEAQLSRIVKQLKGVRP